MSIVTSFFAITKSILFSKNLLALIYIPCYSFKNYDLPSWLSLPRVVNIIRYVKDSRNTACGHNDFCSVRLNGPIWWFILTHRYRLSLSQFTEAVMTESATGATFAAQKQESPDAKVSCPSGCCRIIKAYRYCQSQ